MLHAIALQATVQIEPGLTLSEGTNSYTITYANSSDCISILDTLLIDGVGSYYFSYVQISPDYYDRAGEERCPIYPAYTLHLQLPQNATNIQLQINYLFSDNHDLKYPYLPVLLTPGEDDLIVDFDSNLYNDSILLENYYNKWGKIDSPYQHLGCLGIDFTLYPVHYHYGEKVDVLREAQFVITYSGSPLEDIYDEHNNFAINYFDNYSGKEEFENVEPTIHGDEYLIITERQYRDTIEVFKNFKESLGYNVTVEYVDEVGRTPDAIRHCIKSNHDQLNTKFVLLVGSLDNIPFSKGDSANFFRPPTDLYYSCIDQSDIAHQTHLHPSVLLGRWDVSNKYELSRIIRKTIKSERSMYAECTNRIHAFSGIGTLSIYDHNFVKWIKSDVINASNHLIGNYTDGRYASTSNPTYYDMKMELEDTDYPLLMFIYSGHGWSNLLGDPYDFYTSSISNCTNDGLDYQPFGFAFSCLVGNIYEDNCFASSWITDKNGGITMMAATAETTCESNKWFGHKIMKALITKRNTLTIGEFVANAKEKFYYADQVAHRRYFTEKYLFLGDPSLYIYGLPMTPLSHSPEQNSKTIKETIPDFVRVYSTDGKILMESKYDSFQTTKLITGIYFVQYIDDRGNIINSDKIVITE